MATIVGYILCIALTVQFISVEVKIVTLKEQMAHSYSRCAAEGCFFEPKLKSLCPRINDTTTILKIVNATNRCLSNTTCGFAPGVTFKPEGRPKFGNESVCLLLKVGTFGNVSHARVTDVSLAEQQVNITIFIPDLTTSGNISCDGGQINIVYNHIMTFNYTIVYDGTDVILDNPKFTIINFANDLSPQRDIIQSVTRQVISEQEAMFSSFVITNYKTYFGVASLHCPK